MGNKNKKIFDTIETLIGVGTTFTRDICVTSSLRVDGKIVGNIKNSGGVIVGDKAKIKGNISTEYIIVDGIVEGNITSGAGIELLNKAKVIGDIKTTILSINEGAVFHEKSLMFEKEEVENNDTNNNDDTKKK